MRHSVQVPDFSLPARAPCAHPAGLLLGFLLLTAAQLAAQEWRVASPFGARSNALAFDSARTRMVLFGGRCSRGPFADTWEHDGTAWRQMATTHFPPARASHALAFDRARRRTVLFGGMVYYGNLFDDTWEYDGSDWTQVVTAVRPPPRAGHALVFHAANSRILLFGGSGGTINTCFGDTWQFDGTSWTQAAAAPPARTGHAMAYDETRRRTVLFGGLSCSGQFLGDTWEWDGTSWSARAVTGPSARSGFAMAYDYAHTVLYGGGAPLSLVDTWEYDGNGWTQSTGTGPAARTLGMAYDSARATTMLFASQDDGSAGFWRRPSAGPGWQQLVAHPPVRIDSGLVYDWARARTVLHGGIGSAETWQFDGSNWARLTPAFTAPEASSFGIAYDVGRDRIVRFGGCDSASAVTNSTWEFDGSNWAQRLPANMPPARDRTAMVYDLQRQRIVLFGGSFNFFTARNDTWEYDGTDWTQLTPATSPSGRLGHGLAYDLLRMRTVLFGGGATGPLLTDTWEWDGINWTRAPTLHAPPPRAQFAMTYDVSHQRVLLYGGTTGTQPGNTLLITVDDTWAYDGTDWSAVPTVNTAGGRCRHAMSYDFTRRRSVLIGDWTRFDTWELYADAAGCVRNGAGCAGSAGVPSLDAAPNTVPLLGSTFTLDLSVLPPQPGLAMMVYGFGRTYWNGARLPQSLAPAGLPGCSLWIAPAVAVIVPHAGSVAHASLAIPANPALAGLALDAQGLSFDAAAPSGVGAVSNAVILVVN